MTTPLDDAAVEAAARRLCELRGWDPDERVAHGAEPDARGFVPMMVLYSPCWKRVARDLHELDLAMCALRFVREQP